MVFWLFRDHRHRSTEVSCHRKLLQGTMPLDFAVVIGMGSPEFGPTKSRPQRHTMGSHPIGVARPKCSESLLRARVCSGVGYDEPVDLTGDVDRGPHCCFFEVANLHKSLVKHAFCAVAVRMPESLNPEDLGSRAFKYKLTDFAPWKNRRSPPGCTMACLTATAAMLLAFPLVEGVFPFAQLRLG